jgi:hypothetical protein
MAISVTNIGQAAAKQSTALSITVPAGGVPATANIYVLMAALATGGPTAGDSKGNSYDNTLAAGFAQANGSLQSRLSLAPSPASNPLTALVSGDTISAGGAVGQTAIAFSAFYVTGLVATATNEFDTSGGGTGSSTSPLATATSGTAVSGELIIGLVATNGPSGDTFTQDSTNQGGFTTPPTRVGTTGSGATSNVTLAGGVVAGWNSTGTAKYNPTITSRAWCATVATFEPAPPDYTPYNPWPQLAPMLAQ